jgi:hypothetical protein
MRLPARGMQTEAEKQLIHDYFGLAMLIHLAEAQYSV